MPLDDKIKKLVMELTGQNPVLQKPPDGRLKYWGIFLVP